MKKEINLLRILLILVLAVILIAVSVVVCLINGVDYDELTEVRIKRRGTMVFAGDEYSLTLKNGTWYAAYRRYEWGEEEENETAVDDAFVTGIKNLLRKNKAHKWDDFNIEYEIEKMLASIATDGEHYSFYMAFSDGSTTEIMEYNVYPKTFMTVLKGFEAQFETLFGEGTAS